MTSISWNAEGGSDGTATTTGNSGGASGTAWDTCQRGTNATNEFDTAQKANGSLSVLIATGGTSTTAYNRWSTALTLLWATGLTTHYGRFYFRLAGLPAANRVICELLDVLVATNRANIQVLTTGAIRLRNAANGTVATTTATISVDTWYRLEYRIDGSTTGAYELHLYAGNNVSAIESIVGGTANFGGAIGAAAYGYVSNGASLANLWFDGIQINDVSLPGPESSGTTVVLGQAVETSTAQAVTRIKTRTLGQAAETETAQAVTGSKTRLLGQAAETNTATVLGRAKTTALGQAAESSVAQAIGRIKTATLGQAAETSTAQPVGRSKTRTLGQATETDTAMAITSGGEQRDLDVVIGPPEGKWIIGPPEAKYLIGAPE